MVQIDPGSRHMLHKHSTIEFSPSSTVAVLEDILCIGLGSERPFTELLGLLTLSWRHTRRRLTQSIRKWLIILSIWPPTLDNSRKIDLSWIDAGGGEGSSYLLTFYIYNPISVRFASLSQFVYSSMIRIWFRVILARDSTVTEANMCHSRKEKTKTKTPQL